MKIEITDKRKTPLAISLQFRWLPGFERLRSWLRIDWLYWLVDIHPLWVVLALPPVLLALVWLWLI
ncbi:MAG TPA: hypothetical protein PLB10_18845 [Thiolinea sp.]|nr:hypothetical protein [Thiolinea sp.]